MDIFKNEKFKYTNYIERSNKIASNIQEKLSSREIEWTKISSFFSQNKNNEENEKNENALKDRLLSIFLNDENMANKIKADLEEYNITIKTKLNSLNLILEDFLGFFSETQKENIVELEALIKKLSSGPINSYDKNKEKIENLINQFEEKAKIRNEKNKSSFYSYIYRENKNKFKKYNEQQLVDKTENDFNKLKIIFNNEGIQALNKNENGLLKICLDAIKGKKHEEILN